MPQLVESSVYLGPFITCSIAGATPEEAKTEAEGLAANFELGTATSGDREIVAPSSRLDRLDWQIIRELRGTTRT